MRRAPPTGRARAPDVARLVPGGLLSERQQLGGDVGSGGADQGGPSGDQRGVERDSKGRPCVELGFQALGVDQEVVQVEVGVALFRSSAT